MSKDKFSNPENNNCVAIITHVDHGRKTLSTAIIGFLSKKEHTGKGESNEGVNFAERISEMFFLKNCQLASPIKNAGMCLNWVGCSGNKINDNTNYIDIIPALASLESQALRCGPIVRQSLIFQDDVFWNKGKLRREIELFVLKLLEYFIVCVSDLVLAPFSGHYATYMGDYLKMISSGGMDNHLYTSSKESENNNSIWLNNKRIAEKVLIAPSTAVILPHLPEKAGIETQAPFEVTHNEFLDLFGIEDLEISDTLKYNQNWSYPIVLRRFSSKQNLGAEWIEISNEINLKNEMLEFVGDLNYLADDIASNDKRKASAETIIAKKLIKNAFGYNVRQTSNLEEKDINYAFQKLMQELK